MCSNRSNRLNLLLGYYSDLLCEKDIVVDTLFNTGRYGPGIVVPLILEYCNCIDYCIESAYGDVGDVRFLSCFSALV